MLIPLILRLILIEEKQSIRSAFITLGMAILLITFSDLIYSYVQIGGFEGTTSIIFAGWMLGSVLIMISSEKLLVFDVEGTDEPEPKGFPKEGSLLCLDLGILGDIPGCSSERDEKHVSKGGRILQEARYSIRPLWILSPAKQKSS